ncbi:hypothetical protein ACHAXA_003176 [Cyclostephanos tholiformis]|uniref:NADAR domain-containing protein n=1 Tax=Cyclostephanos tholiformis TaxID=382380 RepID=A0ABD3SSB2_9STRA
MLDASELDHDRPPLAHSHIRWAGTHVPDGWSVSTDPRDYVFFLSKDDVEYGCFSNAYREVDGHIGVAAESSSTCVDDPPRYWCVNQELHHRKALLFDDHDTARLILDESDDAARIKELGRMVRGYDDLRWREVRYEICRDAILGKFSRNEELKNVLLGTESRIIVEATRDEVWGIGCLEFTTHTSSTTHPGEDHQVVVGAKNKETGGWDTKPSDWKGSNLLGRCLMDVRRHLRC